MDPFLILAAALLGFVGTPVLGMVVKWVDRLVTARIQWREGPPIYQTFADVMKLLGKETLVSKEASVGIFLLAPAIGLAGAGVAATILWVAALNPGAGFPLDIVVVYYVLLLPALALILGGSASGSPHAALGASREMKLVLSYELPFVLAIAAALLNAAVRTRTAGAAVAMPQFSFQFLLAPAADGATPASIALARVSGVLACLCALAVMQAKLGLVPFDQTEAETELMGGAMVEYSGPPLALLHLTRWMLLVVLPMLVITVFWGGVELQGWGLAATVGKFLALVVIIVLMRNTNARLRIDQVMKFFWFMVTPVALVACVLSLLAYYG